jgi:predicted MPP superfamily phosphohydrolase
VALSIGFNQPVIVREVRIALRRLPPSFSPLRVLHFSDVHLAGRRKQEERLLGLLSSLPADMIAFCGDVIFRYTTSGTFGLSFFERLSQRVRPRLGMHLVRGNHDNAEVVRLLIDAGYDLLLNRHTVIREGDSSMYLIGVDDPRWGPERQPKRWQCHELHKAMAGVPADAFKIVLSHSPDILPDAASAGVDLVLAGHSHGGQIRLPWLGALMTRTRIQQRYAWGLQTWGETVCHTTCGAGSSFPPIRLSCPQEIVLLELVRS